MLHDPYIVTLLRQLEAELSKEGKDLFDVPNLLEVAKIAALLTKEGYGTGPLVREAAKAWRVAPGAVEFFRREAEEAEDDRNREENLAAAEWVARVQRDAAATLN
jgi:hypothetical protein